MMGLTSFDFEGAAVRTLTLDEEPWFVGRDVCRCLEIVNESQALERLDDEERQLKGVCSTDPLGGNQQQTVVINEPGLYRLIFESRKPAAERFKRWVFHEVLPAIRRTGEYRPGLSAEDQASALALIREVRLTHGRAAAVALWERVGLPAIPDTPSVPAKPASAHQADLLGVVQAFLEDCAQPDPAARVQASELYKAFKRWAGITGQPTMTETMFGKTMPRTGYAREDGRTRFYLGLRLRAEVLRRLDAGTFNAVGSVSDTGSGEGEL